MTLYIGLDSIKYNDEIINFKYSPEYSVYISDNIMIYIGTDAIVIDNVDRSDYPTQDFDIFDIYCFLTQYRKIIVKNPFVIDVFTESNIADEIIYS